MKLQINPLFFVFTFLFFVSESLGVVNIYFEQVGSDVKVSAVGTLALDGSTSLSADNNIDFINTSSLVSIRTGSFRTLNGFSGSTGVSDYFAAPATSPSTFGFSSGTIYFDSSGLVTGTTGAPTLLEWNADDHFFMIPDVTLATIGADDLTGQVAWTANVTGDTITLGVVPEPATLGLIALAAMPLMLRRRRG